MSVPQFAVVADHDLLAIPEVFGLAGAAGPFPRLTAEPVRIDSARQAARAVFGATGFEAAAVTAMALMAGGAFKVAPNPHSLAITFDRPFGFVARQRSTGLILFAGWVADVKDEAPAGFERL